MQLTTYLIRLSDDMLERVMSYLYQGGWDVMPETSYHVGVGMPWTHNFEIGLAVKRQG